MVGMDGDLAPERDVVEHAIVWLHLPPFLGLEGLARELAGRTVDAQSGNLATPAFGLVPAVIQVAEVPSLEEAFAYVLDTALDVRFVFGLAHARRIDEEAASLAVLEEAPSRPRLQGVGTGDGGGEVVENETFWNPAEEAPGGFQAGDALGERLPQQRPDEAVAAVGEDNEQRPDRLLLSRARIDQHSEPAEVHLGYFARRPVGHPHRTRSPLPEPCLPDVAPERRVRDRDAVSYEQLVDARQLKPLLLQPPGHLLLVPCQPRCCGRLSPR